DAETGEIHWDKPPLNARTGGAASSTDPSTWSTFEEALAAYEAGGLDGVGFVLHRDAAAGDAPGLVAVDLDDCCDLDAAEVEERALNLTALLRSYTEISPSGKGIRTLLLGKLPPTGRRKGDFEVYETGRYVTITGQRLDALPATLELRQAELEKG